MHDTIAFEPLQLRKVTDRVIPPRAPKGDERDSLLEMIRTKVRVSNFRLIIHAVRTLLFLVFKKLKFIYIFFCQSFNLRPAAVQRPPSIQGPKTNLRVAAILEKANSIRQVSLSDYYSRRVFLIFSLSQHQLTKLLLIIELGIGWKWWRWWCWLEWFLNILWNENTVITISDSRWSWMFFLLRFLSWNQV